MIENKNEETYNLEFNKSIEKLKEASNKLCSITYNTILEVLDSQSDKDKKIKVIQGLCNNLQKTFDNYNRDIVLLLQENDKLLKEINGE